MDVCLLTSACGIGTLRS